MASWDCSPLRDISGRIRNAGQGPMLLKPSMFDAACDTPYLGAENLNSAPAQQLSHGQAQAIQQKLFEQKKRIFDAENKVVEQQDIIRNLSDQLVKTAARERAQEYPETRLELAAVRRELEDARRQVESKDAEIENLLPQAVVNRMNGSHRLRSQDSEIERLRQELDKTRSELAAIHPQLHDAHRRLENKDAEIDRLLPQVLAARMNPSHGGVEVDQLRRELGDTRAELARKNMELQQARQDVESKTEELRRLGRALDSQSLQNKVERLTPRQGGAAYTLTPRRGGPSYTATLHLTPRNDTVTIVPKRETDHFNQARAEMEVYLDRRERIIEDREAMMALTNKGSLWDRLP